MELESINIIILIAFILMLLSMMISLYRLIFGPSVYDRIVALDLIASIVMGFIILYSVVVNKALYFDVVIIISLVSFIGTVSISTYLKTKKR
jgi:multicomponent Na+:H+ antiporter subunit F